MVSLAEKIKEANASLIEDGNLEMISHYFAADYVIHLTGRDVKGGIVQ